MSLLTKITNAFTRVGTEVKGILARVQDIEDSRNYKLNTPVKTGELWIDGKPIYRCVSDCLFNKTITQSTSIPLSFIPTNFFMINCYFVNENGYKWQFMLYPYVNTNRNLMFLFNTTYGNKLEIGNYKIYMYFKYILV